MCLSSNHRGRHYSRSLLATPTPEEQGHELKVALILLLAPHRSLCVVGQGWVTDMGSPWKKALFAWQAAANKK